jgi:hypothetical protein
MTLFLLLAANLASFTPRSVELQAAFTVPSERL